VESKKTKYKVKPKGIRLNWTPVAEAKVINLMKLDVIGKIVDPGYLKKIQNKLSDSDQLLVP
jgi:hypothetical protein